MKKPMPPNKQHINTVLMKYDKNLLSSHQTLWSMVKHHRQCMGFRQLILVTLITIGCSLSASLAATLLDAPPGVITTTSQSQPHGSWFHKKQKQTSAVPIKPPARPANALPAKTEPMLRLPAMINPACPAGMYLVVIAPISANERHLTLVRQNQPCGTIMLHLTAEAPPEPVRVGVDKGLLPPRLSTRWSETHQLSIMLDDNGKHFESDPVAIIQSNEN